MYIIRYSKRVNVFYVDYRVDMRTVRTLDIDGQLVKFSWGKKIFFQSYEDVIRNLCQYRGRVRFRRSRYTVKAINEQSRNHN